METKTLSNFITQFEGLTKKPEKYISLQEDQAQSIKLLTKELYNFTKRKENPKNKSSEVLDELIIADLDEEQIWQQVELQNNLIYNSLVSDVAHLLAKKDSLKFPIKKKPKKKLSNENHKENTLNEKGIIEDKKTRGQLKGEKIIKPQKQKSSIVDDKFFKLHEMEEFLEKIEKQGETNEDDDDAEINYFEDESISNDDDNEEQLHYSDFFDQPIDQEGFTINKKEVTKKQKFDLEENVDDEDDDEADENEEDDEGGEGEDQGNLSELEIDNSYEDEDSEKFNLKEMRQGDDDDDDDDTDEASNIYDVEDEADNDADNDEDNNAYDTDHDDDEEEEEEENEYDKNKTNNSKHPSTFEARQERLKVRIQNLEEEALKEKSWQLKGEVTAKNRPQNSLLEEYVEFDMAARPAPVLTEKSTLKLEDVIIQRIKDKAWDDVIRKFKPIENDIEYKKKLVLDQEKSKLSLAQIYEKEYLKQLDSKNENSEEKPDVEPPEYQEIRNMMNNLFNKLDALSNFHFTPKQVQPEVKIVSNLPAINMEEVAPIAISDATLLAPEEVKPKSKGDLLGKSERTATDKKRERRQKKLRQKLKNKQMEAKAKMKLEKSDSKDPNKKVSQKFLQKIAKTNNITQLEENKDEKYIKSSNAFFSKLQSKTEGKINKKNIDLKKMKLGKVNAKKSKAR